LEVENPFWFQYKVFKKIQVLLLVQGTQITKITPPEKKKKKKKKKKCCALLVGSEAWRRSHDAEPCGRCVPPAEPRLLALRRWMSLQPAPGWMSTGLGRTPMPLPQKLLMARVSHTSTTPISGRWGSRSARAKISWRS
jgi:hypothetical protein